jgi:hypothetical protein
MPLESSRGQLQHGFQQRRCCRAPGSQDAFLVLSQILVAMPSGMVHQPSAELAQRLYDLLREVVRIHGASPRPAVAADGGGSLRVIRSHYPAAPALR